MTDAILKKLLLVSLTIEQAVQDGAMDDVQNLVAERARIIDSLHAFSPLVESETIRQVFACDQRIATALESHMRSHGDQMRQHHVGAKARRAYGNIAA